MGGYDFTLIRGFSGILYLMGIHTRLEQWSFACLSNLV